MLPLLSTVTPVTHSAETAPLAAEALTAEHEPEVLAFLAARPIHTVFMTGMIRDNGLVSPLNRGTFYGCRNTAGELEGAALIGHATLVEARSESALAAFARAAQGCLNAHMIMGEQEKIERFWRYYSEGGSPARLLCRELLFEQRWPVEVREPVRGLRQATPEDLDLIVPVHAALAFEESGVDPLQKDAEGFRRRCAWRIERGRVWVWVEGGRLVFKADIMSDTPEVVYLEGVYVSPEDRGRGYGLRCVSQLGRSLLGRSGSICVLVNEQNTRAHRLYRRANYKLRGYYDTIFLQQ